MPFGTWAWSAAKHSFHDSRFFRGAVLSGRSTIYARLFAVAGVRCSFRAHTGSRTNRSYIHVGVCVGFNIVGEEQLLDPMSVLQFLRPFSWTLCYGQFPVNISSGQRHPMVVLLLLLWSFRVVLPDVMVSCAQVRFSLFASLVPAKAGCKERRC